MRDDKNTCFSLFFYCQAKQQFHSKTKRCVLLWIPILVISFCLHVLLIANVRNRKQPSIIQKRELPQKIQTADNLQCSSVNLVFFLLLWKYLLINLIETFPKNTIVDGQIWSGHWRYSFIWTWNQSLGMTVCKSTAWNNRSQCEMSH